MHGCQKTVQWSHLTYLTSLKWPFPKNVGNKGDRDTLWTFLTFRTVFLSEDAERRIRQGINSKTSALSSSQYVLRNTYIL